jgi:hypothetical protein
MHVEPQARRYNKVASSNRGVFFALPLVGQDHRQAALDIWLWAFLSTNLSIEVPQRGTKLEASAKGDASLSNKQPVCQVPARFLD